MALVLVVDSNPDTQRALSGLLKYRTRHTFEMVDSCTEGARRAVSMAPDLVMINALMFMANNYAFPRVMQQHDKTAGISFLVHTARDVGELTRKQIEASGVAGMIELPISAEELDVAIVKSSERSKVAPTGPGVVRSVEWQRVEKTKPEPITETHKGKAVQSVQWQTISPEEAKKTKVTRGRSVQTPKEQTPKRDEKPRVFRPLEKTAKREEAKPAGFQASSFRPVEDEDAVKNKKPEPFKAQTWDEVNPSDTVKKPRR